MIQGRAAREAEGFMGGENLGRDGGRTSSVANNVGKKRFKLPRKWRHTWRKDSESTKQRARSRKETATLN